jgi:hypothetical protein
MGIKAVARVLAGLACLAGLLLPAACLPVRPLPGQSLQPAATPTVGPWQEVRQWTPYPYTTPLPPQQSTALDGIYVRFDPRMDERPPCRRCPPYPPAGGVWKLELNKGVFRVYHPRTGWRTLGSFTVEDDRITLFNDPQCHLAVGEFHWQRNEEGLHFQLVADDCELGTRAGNFTAGPWASCQPPDQEAAVTGHWKTPEGCDP